MVLIGLLAMVLAHADEPIDDTDPDTTAVLAAPAEPDVDGDTEAITPAGVQIDAGDDSDVPYEIIVYDELAAELARQEVIERLEEIGYDEEIERDGYVIYRHPDAWRGDVRLHEDGFVQVKRQPIHLDPPIGRAGSPLGTISCAVLLPFCTRFGGQTVGRRKLQAQKTRTVQFLDPELDEWGDRIADRELSSRLQTLPDELEALWFEGTPLPSAGEGSEDAAPVALDTVDERKAALLAYWDSRTNTVWGDRVRLTVEAFLRAVVQPSDDAFTAAELRAFNDARASERALDLSSPWETVAAGLAPGVSR